MGQDISIGVPFVPRLSRSQYLNRGWNCGSNKDFNGFASVGSALFSAAKLLKMRKF
jgi:hypothetical protein